MSFVRNPPHSKMSGKTGGARTAAPSGSKTNITQQQQQSSRAGRSTSTGRNRAPSTGVKTNQRPSSTGRIQTKQTVQKSAESEQTQNIDLMELDKILTRSLSPSRGDESELRSAERELGREVPVLGGREEPVLGSPMKDSAFHEPDPSVLAQGARLAMSLNLEENFKSKSELRSVKGQMKQLQDAYKNEQEIVLQLRRKLNTVERERLEDGTKVNDEMVTMQTQVTSLRCQLEQQMAENQNLAYELTVVKREKHNTLTDSNQQQSVLVNEIEQLKSQLRSNENRMEDLKQQWGQSLHEAKHQTEKLNNKCLEKDKEIETLKTEVEVVRAERERLETVMQSHESNLTEYKEKIQQLQDEIRIHSDTIRRQVNELEFSRDRELRIKQDTEAAQQRVRGLEESVEAERAAHLETKFNSEIIQLRVRDLEGALNSEKTARTQTVNNADTVEKQLRDLEEAYANEHKQCQTATGKLSVLEREHESVKQLLTKQLDEKKSIITNLSKQLELHEKNFDELKKELSKAKKRQVHLEETYGGNMRELELLLDNFNLESKSVKKSRTVSPSVVLENLRHTLLDYKRKLNMTSEELSKMKTHCETLGKECDSYKDMIWTKDKSLEETQHAYSQSCKELSRLRIECSELQSGLTSTKTELQDKHVNLSRDRLRVEELTNQMDKLEKKKKKEDQDKMNSLHSIYQRLLAGTRVPDVRTTQVDGFTWSDVSNMVHEQISVLVNSLGRYEEKSKHLETVVETKESLLDQMQLSHESQINKLESLSKERENCWQKQKTELEDHYTQLLTDIHTRQKKSQTMADEAWERMKQTGSVQQALESECSKLRQLLNDNHEQKSGLLSVTALIIGAFYPLYQRYNALTAQCQFLQGQVSQGELLKYQARVLTDTISASLDTEGDLILPFHRAIGRSKYSAILRFRRAVIAVLAANRLIYFSNNTTRLFTSYDMTTGFNSINIVSGSSNKTHIKLKGVGVGGEGKSSQSRAGYDTVLEWLSSPQLLQTLMNSTNELQDLVNTVRKDGGETDPKLVVNAARNSFRKLMDKLPTFFEQSVQDSTAGFHEKHSLIKNLRVGLNYTLKQRAPDEKIHLTTSTDLMKTLQTQLLDLTQALHTAEIERRDLKTTVNSLQILNEQLTSTSQRAQVLESELSALKSQADKLVEMERFEQVCLELNATLKREQIAQEILSEQNKQIQEMSDKLDVMTDDDSRRNTALTDAMQGLSEARIELKRKEQVIRQLNKQSTHFQEDNKLLLHNIKDAENALRTTSKDRDILTQYMKNVESVLEKVKRKLAVSKRVSDKDTMTIKKLLDGDLLPADISRVGPEVLLCQNLVTSFVDAQQQLFSKFRGIEDELETHRRHITLLKQELNAACCREFDVEQNDCLNTVVIPVLEKETVIQTDDNHSNNNGSNSFIPLALDDDTSFTFLQTNNSAPVAVATVGRKSDLTPVGNSIDSNRMSTEPTKPYENN
ncbi:coiled-coil domain-containing protein 171-like [Tubulanus polymorphus]|uniref:coiled-coil domain-containing protein 171-like n=1 Tax=Tubulanus polymorphus TaxID=672921 RepID=UPI003DA4384F